MTSETLGKQLRLALRDLDSLPPMPEIAQKLLALPLATAAGEAQLLHLIEQDPQLSARIIGLANAPALGVGRKIHSIRDAALLLGMQRLKLVAIGIASLSKFLNQPAGKQFDPHDLWTHSMTIAIVMSTLAAAIPKRIRPDENQIFLAGLLHDIGLMALHYLDVEASEELHHQVRTHPKRSIVDIEFDLLGLTHGHIGAQLARHWHLPQEIIDVVGLHHSPRISEVSLANPLVRLVNIAERLLPDFGVAEHTVDEIAASEWAELCIDPSQADELRERVSELAIQMAQLPDAYETLQPTLPPLPLDGAKPLAHVAADTVGESAASTAKRKSLFAMVLRWLNALAGWLRGLFK